MRSHARPVYLAGGGNALSPLKTLKLDALQKTGCAEVEPLANLLRPKNEAAFFPPHVAHKRHLRFAMRLLLGVALLGVAAAVPSSIQLKEAAVLVQRPRQEGHARNWKLEAQQHGQQSALRHSRPSAV